MAARKKAARSGGKTARKTKAASTRTAKKRKAAKKTSKAAAAGVARPARGKQATRGKASPKRSAARRKPARAASAAAGDATFPEISELAELMERHGLVEVEFERTTEGDTRIHVRRAEAAAPVVTAPVAAAPAVAPASAAGAPAGEPAPAAPAEDEGLHAFTSPMVGTFYRAPSPEASPFASVGDNIDPSNTVCIIEAMKVMNEITPDVAGEVVSIEVENGEAVEFGQTLMLIRPR